MPEAMLTTRFTLLREVFQLARAQRHAIQDDDLLAFSDLLERRQALIDELMALSDDDEELPPNVILFPGAVPTVDDDRLALDTLIRGILEHDRQNESLLAEMMGGVRDQLAVLGHGTRSVAKYAACQQEVGFIDRVS